MRIVFCDFDLDFLDYSWMWLNDLEIKRLTNTPDFTKESQLNWFNSLQHKSDYLILGVKIDEVPVGVCGLKNINNDDGEYWGYIGEKTYWGKGIGFQMMKKIEEIAMSKGLNSIWLQVLEKNERAIRLYKSLSYKIVSSNNNLIIMRKLL